MDGRLFPPQNKQMIFYLTVLFFIIYNSEFISHNYAKKRTKRFIKVVHATWVLHSLYFISYESELLMCAKNWTTTE